MSADWSGSPERGPLALSAVDGVKLGSPRRAVFVDRDGTLNEGAPDPDSGLAESPLHVAQVRLIAGAAAAARELAAAGYQLVCVTNQPAAAKGKATLDQLLEIHERVLKLLAEQGVQIASSRLCPHHPEGVVEELARPCGCRKPAPGMLLEAAAELGLDPGSSWMLGDTDADVGAGVAAGCRTALIEYPPSAHKRRGATTPDVVAADIGRAVAQLLDHRPR